MAAKYRKIDTRIWDDEKFEELAPLEKLVAFNVLTGQSNRVGLFKLSLGKGAEQTGMSADSYGIAIGRVCDTLNWGFDKTRSVVFIPSWFKYNPPENPKHLAGCLSDLHEIPQTDLLAVFKSNVTHIPRHCLEVWQKSVDSYGIAIPIAMPYQKQEQKQEQKNTPQPPKGEKSGVAEKRHPHPVKDEITPGFLRFWSAWPSHERKIGKANCVRIWKRTKLEPIAERVIDALERCKVSRGWTKDHGEYIPAPERWLRKTPWLTDPTETCGQPVPDEGNHDPSREDLPWIQNRGVE